MAWVPPTPRCGEPVEFRDLPGRTDYEPVCWRPAGHPNPSRHMSKYAYLNQRERVNAWHRKNRGVGRMSDPGDRT